MNESHVRRARLHLDKKKKKFEQQPIKQNSQSTLSQVIFDGQIFSSDANTTSQTG